MLRGRDVRIHRYTLEIIYEVVRHRRTWIDRHRLLNVVRAVRAERVGRRNAGVSEVGGRVGAGDGEGQIETKARSGCSRILLLARFRRQRRMEALTQLTPSPRKPESEPQRSQIFESISI